MPRTASVSRPCCPAPNWPNANQGAAILAERDSLLETLDAVKDLLMAENAFQLVQGNFDRVAAVSLAQKDARIPPRSKCSNTPRGTQFTFTNRVTLHFDDLDPTLAASNPWPAGRHDTARVGGAGRQLLARRQCSAAHRTTCRCEVWRVVKAADGTETRADIHAVTLADLQLQPIDFVALAGINSANAQGATELETRVARQLSTRARRRDVGMSCGSTSIRRSQPASTRSGSCCRSRDDCARCSANVARWARRTFCPPREAKPLRSRSTRPIPAATTRPSCARA